MWPFSRKRDTANGALPALRKSVSYFWGVGAARFMNHRYQAFASEGYSLNPIANSCITLLANSIASVGLQVFEKKGAKVNKLDSHPLIDLLDNPNPQMSTREFLTALVSFYLIGGNTYIMGVGVNPDKRKGKPPLELQLLRPEATTVRPGTGVFPEQYEYRQINNGAMLAFPVNQINGFSQVLHLKTFNPLDQWVGMSPMVAAAYGIDTFNSGMRWNKALLDNDARPAGAFTVKDAEGKPSNLDDQQFLRLREEIKEKYSSAANAGRPMILEGGLEWQQMSMTSKDMDHEKNMLTMARFTAGVYHVPPQLVNIPGESTYNNYEQAKLAFWSDTVLPLLGNILDGLNRWLCPMYGPDIYIAYDPDSIDALEPLRKEKAARVKGETWLTMNEQRRAMGKDDLPKKIGDAILITGRGVLLGLDGEVISFEGGDTTEGVPSATAPDPNNPKPPAKPGKQPKPVDEEEAKSTARFRKLLIDSGYTEERADRIVRAIQG